MKGDKNHKLVISAFSQTSDPEKFPVGLPFKR